MRRSREECRDLNDRNGVLVGAQIKRVEGLLGAMTGTSAEPRAYGPRGQSNPYSASSGTFSPLKPEAPEPADGSP